MKKTNYANLLTEEQKEAFRKGDAYYVSPFKNKQTKTRLMACSCTVSVEVYVTSSRSRIHEAMLDSWRSKSWN